MGTVAGTGLLVCSRHVCRAERSFIGEFLTAHTSDGYKLTVWASGCVVASAERSNTHRDKAQ